MEAALRPACYWRKQVAQSSNSLSRAVAYNKQPERDKIADFTYPTIT